MGMLDYETRGYGVQFDNRCGNNTTVERINKMLELAPCLKKEIYDWFNDCGLSGDEITVEVFADFDEDFRNGIPALIAKAMNEHYDSNFIEAASDDNGFIYLYMPYYLPWGFDTFARNLTEEEFCNTIRKFWAILYDETANIDSISIRTCG
jgi:hypothetical protein